jgi:ABC-type amino acid transport substrate-binding protein
MEHPGDEHVGISKEVPMGLRETVSGFCLGGMRPGDRLPGSSSQERTVVGQCVRVVVDRRNPPFVEEREGLAEGFSVDVLKACFGHEGVDIELIPEEGLASQFMRLSFGGADAALDITMTARRKAHYAFTEHYYLDHLGIMSAGRDWLGSSLRHFRGRATVKAYSYAEEWVRYHHPTVALERVDSTEAQLECVQRGCARALIAGHDTIAVLAAGGSASGLFERGASFAPASLALAALPDREEAVIAPFNAGLRKLVRTGEWERLRQKWFGVAS